MTSPTRIALLHTGAVVISPVMDLVKQELPDATPLFGNDRSSASCRIPASASAPSPAGTCRRSTTGAREWLAPRPNPAVDRRTVVPHSAAVGLCQVA